jgi:hypothetical protein
LSSNAAGSDAVPRQPAEASRGAGN